MKEAELIAELQAVFQQADPADAYTTAELADIMGIGEQAVRRRLHALRKAQRLETVQVTRPNLKGIMQPRTAYRILPNGDPKMTS